ARRPCARTASAAPDDVHVRILPSRRRLATGARRAAPEALHDGRAHASDPQDARFMSITCVIADDHPPVLEFLSRFLSNNEITITASTRDGEDALRKIEQTRPDVAVLDARMPRIGGLEVLRRLSGSDVPTRVILYTGYGDDALL